MTRQQEAALPEITFPAHPDRRVPVGSQTHNEIVQFLYNEANILDNLKLDAWATTLTEDLVYTVPMRTTRKLADMGRSIIRSVQHYNDNYQSIRGRIARMTSSSAWAEDPPSRTRRIVSNVLVYETGKNDEFEVLSHFIITRNRFESDQFDLMSGERHDLLRRVDDRFKLARRDVILDQAVLGMQNLAIFL